MTVTTLCIRSRSVLHSNSSSQCFIMHLLLNTGLKSPLLANNTMPFVVSQSFGTTALLCFVESVMYANSSSKGGNPFVKLRVLHLSLARQKTPKQLPQLFMKASCNIQLNHFTRYIIFITYSVFKKNKTKQKTKIIQSLI